MIRLGTPRPGDRTLADLLTERPELDLPLAVVLARVGRDA